MIQLFSTLLFTLSYMYETIINYFNIYKRKLIKISHIKNIRTNENVLYKYIITKYIYNIDRMDETDKTNTIKDDYYCEFNTDYGIYKTIIKNTTLQEILSQENTINKDKHNLIDGLYGDKLCTAIYLSNSDTTTKTTIKLDIMNYILYIDKNILLSLKELFSIYDIDYSKFNHIVIKYMSYEDYTENCITSNINTYLDKNIIEIL